MTSPLTSDDWARLAEENIDDPDLHAIQLALADPSVSVPPGTYVEAGAVLHSLKDYAASAAQFAVLGNNLSKPLSGFYGSLAAAQVDYPHATALSNELDWAVVQKGVNVLAAAKGGILYCRSGSGFYVFDQELLLPHTTSYGPPVTVLGDGPQATQFYWPVDLGAGKCGVRYSVRHAGGTLHRLENLGLRGPGVGSTLGASTSLMTGVATEARFTMHRVLVTAFKYGIDASGDHEIFTEVQSTNNYINVYWTVAPGAGDCTFIEGDLSGAMMANHGVADGAFMTGRFHGCHHGFAPYGILIENHTTRTNNQAIVECLFDACGFEAIGNGYIYSEGGVQGISNTDFRHCSGSVFDTYRIMARPRDALIHMDGSIASVSFSGERAMATVGDVAYMIASTVSQVRITDAYALVTAVIASGKPFVSTTGTVSQVSLENGPNRYQAMRAAADVAANALVGEYGDRVKPMAAGSNFVGVAVHAALSGFTAIVCTQGTCNAVPAADIAYPSLVTADTTDPTKMAAGTASSYPHVGYITGNVTSGVAGAVVLRSDSSDLTRVQSVKALTDAGTITTDASLGSVFYVTLGGNRTIANPTNLLAGQKIIYRLKQDVTGSRTVTWGSKFRFSTDIPAPTLSTIASKTDYIGFVYNAVDDKLDCVAVTKGF